MSTTEEKPKEKNAVADKKIIEASVHPGGAIRTLETITQHALTLGASDIHLERREKAISLRFRVDGVLREINPPPTHLHDVLIACVKVLARLRTDIRSLPQDGRYTYVHQGRSVDIRVSLVPAHWGEKAVLRLLAKPEGRRSLEDLGFSKDDSVVIRRIAHQPDGLVLVTGPTGSGKTTTLYEILHEVSEKQISVVSLEDPIEYGIERVTQISVREAQQFSFSTALRSLLRQDPDVIMVGEIRDGETAEIAATAALTGHLVLSTLHTLDTPRTIVRLCTMGVPEHIVVPSLSLIISQRLARRVCGSCAVRTRISEWCLAILRAHVGRDVNFVDEMKGAGCSLCAHTGYKGRVVIYEMLVVDERVREIIRTHIRASDVYARLRSVGWRSLVESGCEAVSRGITNCEELFRVIQT